MTIRKLPSLIALSISLELVLAPLPALAEVPTGQQVMDGLNYGLNLYNTVRGNQNQQMPSYVAGDMAALQKQQTPSPDKDFTMQNLSKIPGLMEYIAVQNEKAMASGGKVINPASLNCQTLPTTLHEANNEVCRNRSINARSGNPIAQRDEAFAYYNQYLQIDKLYRNYSERSNVVGQSFGVGCMEEATDILKGFFAYRTEQLDTVMAKMEKAVDKFNAQSEADLKSIRESSAVLNGESSKFVSDDSKFEDGFKDSNLLNFGARLEDPACNSILSKDGMDTLGKGGGLLAIEKKMKDDFDTKPNGSNYTAEQFIGKNSDIISDITKMADKVSEQATLNFSQITGSQDGYSKFLGGISGDVSSESGANAALNKSFFSDIQTKFSKTQNTLNDEAKLISSELGGKGQDAFKLLNNVNSSSSFDAEVTSLESQIKSDCLSRSGLDSALGRIYDPNLSKEANMQSSSKVGKRIKTILSDPNLTPERKMQELQLIENQNSNRFEMRMDASYETQEVGSDGKLVKKTVNASNKVTPGGYFTDLIKNCDSQFQVNKLNNKLSGKETIQRFRALKKDYEKAAVQNSKDLRDEIVKKMINCNNNGAVAASSGVGSCSPESLNMQKPGFCVKAAFSCSKNMQSCTKKAKEMVQKLKDDRLVRTNNYNNNVEKNRQDLVGIFDEALGKYMKEAESLRGMFGVGFTAPTGIERDLKGGNQFNPDYKGAPDSLEIKDPKLYLKMVKENMKALQKEVDKQQEGIIGENGFLNKHIELTRKNYEKNVLDKASKLAGDCLAAYDSYAKLVDAQQKSADDAKTKTDELNGEMGEKNGELCGLYSDIMSNSPDDNCNENIRSLSNSAIKASGKAGSASNKAVIDRMVEDMRDHCKGKPKDFKDALTICAAQPKNFDAIFAKKYNGDVKPPKFTEACIEIQGGESKGYCQKSPLEKTSVTSKNKPGETITGFKDCNLEKWQKPDDTKNVWEGSCRADKTDCAKIESQIKAIYDVARESGELNSNTQANPMPSICNSSDNSGRDNPKDYIPGPGTNSVDQNSGTRSQQQ